MKWLLIILLMPTMLSAQTYDTSYQMVYYQQSLIKKGKFELYGFTSYDLWWQDESGIGITYTLSFKRKRKNIKTWNKGIEF